MAADIQPEPDSPFDPNDLAALREKVETRVSEHRGWYLFEGILFLIVGALAILLPGITAFAVEILVAALLLVTGGAQVVLFFTREGAWTRLFGGLLSVLVGGGMMFFPVVGITALALLIGAFLILEGIVEISMALSYKPSRNWGWLMFSGILALIVGLLVFAFLPVAGMIYIAVAVGLNMIFYGTSLLFLVSKAGKEEQGTGGQERPA